MNLFCDNSVRDWDGEETWYLNKSIDDGCQDRHVSELLQLFLFLCPSRTSIDVSPSRQVADIVSMTRVPLTAFAAIRWTWYPMVTLSLASMTCAGSSSLTRGSHDRQGRAPKSNKMGGWNRNGAIPDASADKTNRMWKCNTCCYDSLEKRGGRWKRKKEKQNTDVQIEN